MAVQIDEAGLFRDLAQALHDCQMAQPPIYSPLNPFEQSYGPDMELKGTVTNKYVIYAERYAPHRSAETVLNIHIAIGDVLSNSKTEIVQRVEQFLVSHGAAIHNSSYRFGIWHLCALWGKI